MHHLGTPAAQRIDRETYWVLHAVEIIIDAGAGEHEKRSRHAAQVKSMGKFLLERILDMLYGHLSGLGKKFRIVFLR